MTTVFVRQGKYAAARAEGGPDLTTAELRTLPDAFVVRVAMLKLQMVGLKASDADKMPADLSGGMIKRVALARALSLEPELVFLDEPTAGLDPRASDDYVALIRELRRELGLTVVMVTHDLDTLVAQLSAKLTPGAEQLRWIKASVGTQLRLIPVDDVLFFQADEKYTLVATTDFDTLIRTPIKELLDGLVGNKFWQIHRSTIINATAVDMGTRDFRGQASVKIKGRPENLAVSRPFSHLFKQM